MRRLNKLSKPTILVMSLTTRNEWGWFEPCVRGTLAANHLSLNFLYERENACYRYVTLQ